MGPENRGRVVRWNSINAVVVKFDRTGKEAVCAWNVSGRYDILVVTKKGDRVVRNPAYWVWEKQDGEGFGKVVDLQEDGKKIIVKWDSGNTANYRFGPKGFDLLVAGTSSAPDLFSSAPDLFKLIQDAINGNAPMPTSGGLTQFHNALDQHGRASLKVRFDELEVYYEDKLGEGSFGVVYACKWGADRSMCVKLLKERADVTDDSLLNEIRLVGALPHPNLASIVAWGVHDDEKKVFFVCKRYNPGSLQKYYDGLPEKSPEEGGRLDWEKFLQIFDGVCHGTAFLHSREFIHRDLKPDNVLLDQDLGAHVTDFGLTTHKTKVENIAGTLLYMAPEQIAAQQTTAASDVFSIGIMMFQLLHDDFPWKTRHCRSPMDIPKTIYASKVQCNSKIPVRIAKLIESCLEHKPRDRPDLSHVAGELEAIDRQMNLMQCDGRVWHL